MAPLVETLHRVRRRLLGIRAVESGLAGAIGAVPVAAAITALRLFLPQHVPMTAAHPALPLVLLPCGFLLGALAALVRGVSLREAAIVADHAAGLKERLATALEVTEAAAARHGILDQRLIEQAESVAEGLDPARLPLARSMGRYAKVLLVAVLVLVVASMVPPVGGPPVTPEAAGRAAATLERLAENPSVTPAIRAQIEKAVADLRQGNARQAGVDQTTAALMQAAAKAERGRQETLAAVAAVENPEVKAMAAAAARGDAQAAASAAGKVAENLGSPAASDGPTPADRERLADGLSGAAAVARREDLAALAATLEAAAEAVRRADPKTAEAMAQLASAMADALQESAGGVAAIASVVGQARRTLNLPELPPSVTGTAASIGETPTEPSTGGVAPGQGVTGTGAEPSGIPAGVQPEDRPVVRRYFGG